MAPLARVRFADAPPATADVVVIGGGVIGCATAFFAARAGLSVVVLERHAALATLTTPVSTGAFRLQFDNPEELELVREGVELFGSFAARTGLDGWDLGLRHGGYLFCSLTDATVERSRRLVERQREWGLTDVEILTGDEARARWPWLAPEVRGARYRAHDARRDRGRGGGRRHRPILGSDSGARRDRPRAAADPPPEARPAVAAAGAGGCADDHPRGDGGALATIPSRRARPLHRPGHAAQRAARPGAHRPRLGLRPPRPALRPCPRPGRSVLARRLGRWRPGGALVPAGR